MIRPAFGDAMTRALRDRRSQRRPIHWRECFGGAAVTVSLVYPAQGFVSSKIRAFIATAEEIPGSKTSKPSTAVICKTLDKYVFVQSLKNKCVDKIFKNLDLSPGDTLENREPGQIAWGTRFLA